jgi:hypothetical protein
VTPLLAFRTDPMDATTTWHGALHAVGYVALMLSMFIAFVTLYPGLIRRSPARAWRPAPLALLLLPPAWLAPNDTATSSYLFFAVPFTLLAGLSLVLATGGAPSADRAPVGTDRMTEPA